MNNNIDFCDYYYEEEETDWEDYYNVMLEKSEQNYRDRMEE